MRPLTPSDTAFATPATLRLVTPRAEAFAVPETLRVATLAKPDVYRLVVVTEFETTRFWNGCTRLDVERFERPPPSPR